MQIWWMRRDLRLEDNPALTAALQAGGGLVPAFILDERLLARSAEKRLGFLFGGLRALEEQLRGLGSGLVVRAGDPAAALARLAAECGAQAVYAEADVSPFARRRDAAVAQAVDLRLVEGLGVHPTAAVKRADGGPYTVFTPYSRAWKNLSFPGTRHPAPTALPPLPRLESGMLPDLPATAGFAPGEREAKRRLAAFLDGPVFAYADDRNRMNIDGTSALSPYLRFGMLSARNAARAVLQAEQAAPDGEARAGCQTWLTELIWREFYQAILYHFPHVLKAAYNPALRNIPWRDAPADLAAWQEGRTGYPVVDAGMRQLRETGWMHNRVRMITASFLVKDLLISWQEGEAWFLRQLVDGDPAANNGGWQWTAGTGTDAAPYFRIFNPILQGKKFDPEGGYVRRWVPELAGVAQKYLHAPWEMPESEQRACGVVIGRQYPMPMVDHAMARERTLAAFAASRK
jgi:deoxyribodipyrimidine photo-lyase